MDDSHNDKLKKKNRHKRKHTAGPIYIKYKTRQLICMLEVGIIVTLVGEGWLVTKREHRQASIMPITLFLDLSTDYLGVFSLQKFTGLNN